MSAPAPPAAQARGILLFMAAILSFALMDMLAKAISNHVHVIQAVWARYAGQTLVVVVMVAPRLGRVMRTHYPVLQFLRSVALLAATTCFFFAISRMGLAEATAIMDLNPVLITLGAAVFLGERFGMRRAAAVAAALVGALIIIRPGADVFSPAAILPFGAAVFYTCYALMTRFVGRDEDVWTSLFYTALVGTLVLSAIVPAVWQEPDATALILMCAIGVVGAFGQLLLIRALSMAEASVVAPFAYVGLIFATVMGALVFGEYPDLPTYAGALVIVVAGLYVWHRENRVKPRAAIGE